MGDSFRKEFLLKYLVSVEKESVHVTPIEVGILHERFSRMVTNTPNEMKPRVFEQLCLSILLWIASSSDVYAKQDIKYIQMISNCKRLIDEIISAFNDGFERV